MTTDRDAGLLKTKRPRTAVAVGNFDGLHLGHARLLSVLCRVGRRAGLRPIVLTFHPHPERALGQGKTLMIQTLEQRLALLRQAGLAGVRLTAFDQRLRKMPPREFVRKVLKNRLKAGIVVVGRDFRFGRNQAGDVQTLETEGRSLGLRVVPVSPVRKNGQVVSSSLIRGLLGRGRVEQAQRLLGRPYEVTGRVVRGRAVGRSLGFPTANLQTDNEILPPGVFISLVRLGKTIHPAVTNIGFRPTFGPGGVSLESVLLDVHPRLYGRRMDVLFLKKLRPERKFASPAGLAHQIGRDVQRAREYFQAHPVNKTRLFKRPCRPGD